MELFKIKRDIPFMSYGKLTTFYFVGYVYRRRVLFGDQRPEFLRRIYRRYGNGSPISAGRGCE